MAFGRALLCAAVAFIASSASAVSTFTFVSGEVHITASAGATPIVDTIVDLDGTFIDFETAPVGVPDFKISLQPTGPIAMLSPYGGYDEFTIVEAILSPGTLYSSSGVLVIGSEYSVLMGPIAVDATYSATDSTLTNPPSGNVHLPIFENPSLTATIDTDLVTFEMMGITLGVIPPLAGESSPLIVKGDITFVGAVVVPEPSTGLLVGMGLFGLGTTQRALRLRESGSHC